MRNKRRGRRMRYIELPCNLNPGERITYSVDRDGNVRIIDYQPNRGPTGFNAFDREVLAGNSDALATMFEE